MQTSVPHIDELANVPTDEPRMAVTLGRNVKRLRERGRINKTCFAAMVGIGRPQLNKIEKGTANVRLSMVEELADALETTPQELLFEQFDPASIAIPRKAPRLAVRPVLISPGVGNFACVRHSLLSLARFRL